MQRKLFIEISDIVNPQITIAKNKYNLPFASLYHVDDGILLGAINAINIWENLGCSYPDGCGNRISYAADVAVNIDAASPQNKTMFQSLISKGGSILNHSAYADGSNRLTQLEIIRNQYLEYLNYMVSGVVVPGADMGYGDAAILHPDLFVTSARGDVYDSMNNRMWYEEIPLNTEEPPYPINRQFTDWDSDEVLNYLLNAIDTKIPDNPNENKFLPIGSHSALQDSSQINRFTEFYTHIKNNYTNDVLVCSFREWAEYILMKSVSLNSEIIGNTIHVVIDDGNVSQIDQVSWFDNCFNVTGATILDVTGEGFDQVNFNSETGLINAHKRKINWSISPVDPIEIMVKHGKFVI